jgi:hypothetical protein
MGNYLPQKNTEKTKDLKEKAEAGGFIFGVLCVPLWPIFLLSRELG